MADIVLGLGTSHTPLLSLRPELWEEYAKGDQRNPELVFPPNGLVMSFDQGRESLAPEIKQKYQGTAPFADQSRRFKRALDTLAETLQAAEADITLVISDDQDEWFYEHNMPRFSVYWGDSVRLIPRGQVGNASNAEVTAAIAAGYGDVAMDVPVPARFGRFLVEYLCDHDFDVGYLTHARQPYGGTVARRYPTPDGELSYVKETPDHEQGQ